MAQEYIKINGAIIAQPDSGLGYSFETTYSDDTTRVQSGRLHLSPVFTVESFSYERGDLTVDQMKTILQNIAKGKSFKLHYFSPYYGIWRDDEFYVGKGSLKVGRLNTDDERYDGLSFNMIGVNPI